MSRCNDSYEEREQAAIQIAVESGAVKRCWVHDDILLDGKVDPEEVHEFVDKLYSSGKLSGFFESRKDMQDAIQSVVDIAGIRCERCADPD